MIKFWKKSKIPFFYGPSPNHNFTENTIFQQKSKTIPNLAWTDLCILLVGLNRQLLARIYPLAADAPDTAEMEHREI